MNHSVEVLVSIGIIFLCFAFIIGCGVSIVMIKEIAALRKDVHALKADRESTRS